MSIVCDLWDNRQFQVGLNKVCGHSPFVCEFEIGDPEPLFNGGFLIMQGCNLGARNDLHISIRFVSRDGDIEFFQRMNGRE